METGCPVSSWPSSSVTCAAASSIAVFLGSLFWFWIWGPVGLFLAVPLLSFTRAACTQFPRAKVVADLLGE